MNTLAYETSSSESIPKIHGNTSVFSLLAHFGVRDEIQENIEFFFARESEGQKSVDRYSQWTIAELIDFLKGFHTLKTCGVLHERDDIPERSVKDARLCQTKWNNPCCGHPEQTGLAQAMLIGEYLIALHANKNMSILPNSVKVLSPLAELDADVGRRSSKTGIIQWFTKNSIDTIRTGALEKQKKLGAEVLQSIGQIILALEALIADAATQSPSSPLLEKSLPQAHLAQIL